MRPVSRAGEAGLLRSIFKTFGGPGRGPILLGSGDDAAAIRVPAGRALVVSQDDQVEGTHFQRSWTDPYRLAGRLIRINLSDLAAMGGARPLACTVSAGLPASLPEAWFRRFLSGLAAHSRRHGLPVAGGNLSRSSRLFFSLAIFGSLPPRSLVRRSGARPGDILAGVGPVGDAAAGLRLLRGKRPVPGWARPLVRRFWEPEPRLNEARRLAGRASSMMDNSDGLRRSIETLAASSGKGFAVRLDEIPASRPLARWCGQRRISLRRFQLDGGEDYGLLFTVPPRDWAAVQKAVPAVYRLGEATVGRGVRIDGSGRSRGFEHFR